MANITSPGALSSLWKAAAKTILKMLTYPEVCLALESPWAPPALHPDSLVLTFIGASIEPVEHSDEEQKLLLKQKVLVKLATNVASLSLSSRVQVLDYLLKVIKQQTVHDLDEYYSLVFGDATKKNLHKLISHSMSEQGVMASAFLERLL
jgi:hypothetical protein